MFCKGSAFILQMRKFSEYFRICTYLLVEINSTSYFFAHEDFLLPTNLTNLHEFIALYYNGDLFGRTNFH